LRASDLEAVDNPALTADVPMMDADARPTAALRVLIILDITASMGAEISAVKSAVAEMVGLCSDMASADPDDEEEQPSLAFAFITFTEDNNSGCHVSYERSIAARQ
jgi:hypothetical protein